MKDKLPCIREGSIWRPEWFIAVRFFFLGGVALVVLITQYLIGIETINYSIVWILAGILLLANISYIAYLQEYLLPAACDSVESERKLRAFFSIQIAVDLLILTLLLHYTGGATNPFFVYYFFHTILSSILLPSRGAYIVATAASLLFAGITVSEGTGLISHYYIFYPALHASRVYMIAIIVALVSGLYIATYMTTSIMKTLRRQQSALEDTVKELQNLEDEKSRLMDVVAHDLKSPIAAIETVINSILHTHGESLPDEAKKMLEHLPGRTQSLLKFINGLLDFSSIKKMEDIIHQFHPFNFLPIVTSMVEIYMTEAQEKNIRMVVQAQPDIPQVFGSRDHLERMVANLLENAINYTPPDGSVTVKVNTKDEEIILTVADTGIGIPEEARPHIFKEFFRAENARKLYPSGTGLGMSIIKSIAERHGGFVEFQSEEGEGTAFTVHLPAYTGEQGK